MNLEQLVTKQLMLCELKKRLETEGKRPPPIWVEDVSYGPCLLLSRECGSGGDVVARLAGEILGWQVFDREIVEEIAQRAHARKQLIESVDERIREQWRERLRLMRAEERFLVDTYERHLREVLLALGHHGDVVIVGRGAHYLLPAESSLRVRVIAPLKWRAQHWTETAGGSYEEAVERVQQCDASRSLFIRKAFGREAGYPLDYDLVINTDHIKLEAAAQAVVGALRAKLGLPAR